MTDAVSTAKILAGGIAAAGAVPAAVEAIQHVERSILGVPQSVLLVAIVGTLIGVLLLPERDADRITADAGLSGRWPRFKQMAVRTLSLGVVLLGYAFVAAWVIALAATWFPSLAGAPQLPLAGISGVLVRRMLPRYLAVAERVTGAIGGKTA